MSTVSNEIDDIIASAMAEYNQLHGIETPVTPTVSSEPLPPPIPENSNSILVRQDTSRFSGAIWYEQITHIPVILAGVGGIGSYVAFMLSRVHPSSIVLYDDDVMEEANMSGQLFSRTNIGQHKVDAISDMMANYSNYFDVVTYRHRFTPENAPITGNVMICGFDNMEARKTYFNAWLEHVKNSPKDTKKDCLFIDGRLAAEEFQVFAIKGDDERAIALYQKDYLFDDWQADTTLCSYKQTSFCANMIGSIIVNIFVNFVANMCDPLIPRDVPFLTEYSAETMYFKVTQ